MKPARTALACQMGLLLAMAVFPSLPLLPAQALGTQEHKAQDTITVTGKLGRVMAIGGESTGWSIHLDHPTTLEGREVDSLEISYAKSKKLAKLENKEVKALGKLTNRHGVETGDQLILEVSSIQELKQN